MKCTQCGREVPAGSAFCPQCGTQLGGATSDADNSAPFSGAQRLTGARPAAAGSQTDERELWVGSYSPKEMVGAFIIAALLAIVGIILAVLSDNGAAWFWLVIGILIMCGALALIVMYRRLAVRYQLTTYRLFHEKGLLARTRDRIEVIDIDDVTLTQGPIERMLDVGTIVIVSSDESLKNPNNPNADGKLLMSGIADVRRVADLIDNTRRAERNRRGVFLENV